MTHDRPADPIGTEDAVAFLLDLHRPDRNDTSDTAWQEPARHHVLFGGGEDHDVKEVVHHHEPQRGDDLEAEEVDINLEVPDSFDDAHVAEALAEHLRHRWLYVAAWGRWLHWDGTRWANDDIEEVHEVARQWVIELVATVARVGASSDDVKRAARYRDRYKLDTALTMARRVAGIATAPGDFGPGPRPPERGQRRGGPHRRHHRRPRPAAA